MIDNKKIRDMFPWFNNNPDYVYLDSGATTLKPKIVIDSVVEYYSKFCTNPHNVDSKLTYSVYQLVQETRKKIANLINASEQEILFCSGATEGLSLLANGIKSILNKDDEIILTYGEHASNLIPWIKIAKEKNAKIKYAGKLGQMPTLNDFIGCVTNKTKIVSFASGFNVTGTRFNDIEICNAIKKINRNIYICVDAVQSIQHRKVDVKLNNCDMLAISAHKMFGPTGIGAVYIRKELQNIIEPLRYGGGMNFTINENDYTLLNNIEKYEGGTPNVAGIYGFNKAIDFINEIGYDFIQEYEKELSNYARKRLSEIENITIYDKDSINSATIAINYKDVFAQDLASYLGQNNIIVRSGLSCAKLICKILDVNQVVRISLYIYNNFDDIDKLINVLKKFKKEDVINGIV